jgi:predicted ATPase
MRARQLCQYLEDPQRLIPVLRGLWNDYVVRPELQTAHALGEQLLTLAQQSQDSAMLVAAHRALGVTLFYRGETTFAYTHFVQGMVLYDPQQHRAAVFLYGDDSGVICHGLSALTLWILGYPDQGLARSQGAVTLAQQIAHPFSLVYALSFATMCHQFRRDVRFTQERADATIILATEQGFPLWRARGAMLRSWALAHQGQVQARSEQITQELRSHRATGSEL